MTYGQPKRKKKKGGDDRTMFKLGQTAASLDQQKKENDQQAILNMAKEMELRTLKNELLDILAEVERRTQLGEQQIAAMAGTPPMPPGVMPDQPGLPPEMMGQGMPPELMQGGPGMPPPDMMGGQVPPPTPPVM